MVLAYDDGRWDGRINGIDQQKEKWLASTSDLMGVHINSVVESVRRTIDLFTFIFYLGIVSRSTMHTRLYLDVCALG